MMKYDSYTTYRFNTNWYVVLGEKYWVGQMTDHGVSGIPQLELQNQ